ncbi:DNA-binding transcriptional LysR family regulator [Paraburkholderia unamae]|uniref:LysR family transcriptional regulator n=1 Tax=Paraburkholderia unamae TaxID=219649 RepID=UPI000DC262B7|nr:LysR substrate-binding domain-containing protein [Paraburkholderia unamae]RAR55373.1 DNA-binding transcriptional LysR family regulator [Paraburkholderia unamae]
MRHLQIYQFIAEVARRGSIRKTADHLHITPSALTRKIQDFEEELGTPVFERLPQGMRLNAAGELLLRHIRDQSADFERLQAQLSELAGIRRGHVTLACSQAFIDSVLPDEIATYRQQFPQVSFSLDVRDNLLGVNALANYEADLALLIDPPPSADVRELLVKHQPLCAVVNKAHPLAQTDSVRLRDCFKYPVAMPSQLLAIRTLLDEATWRLQLQPEIAVESDSLEFLRSFVVRESAVTFLPLSGVPRADERICGRPISTQDLDHLRVVLGQLKGRTLSIAAEKFAEQLNKHLPDSR